MMTINNTILHVMCSHCTSVIINSTPPVNVFNPPSCTSLPVLGQGRNNPIRSQVQTLICHHIPQVIEPCHYCQAYVPYPQRLQGMPGIRCSKVAGIQSLRCLNWSQFTQFLLKLRKCGTNNMNQNCSQN